MIVSRIITVILALSASTAGVSVNAFASEFTPKRNPFQRPFSGMSAAGAASSPGLAAPDFREEQLELKAIIHDGKNSLANISGSIVQAGEFLQGYRIESIEDQKVLLSSGGKQITLSLYRTMH